MAAAHCTRCGAELIDGAGLCARCRSTEHAGSLASRAPAAAGAVPAASGSAPGAAPASGAAPRLSPRGIVVAGAVPVVRRPLDGARAWARGRNPWMRFPLLAWFGYILVRHLRDPDYDSLFGGINLGIHELGHFLLGMLGELPGVAGGTILQLAAPLAAGILFWRQRDRFAVAVASCWLSTNLFNVARYAADARAQELPLVSPTSGDPIHDWHFMLGRWGLLRHDMAIAGALRRLAALTMVAGLVAGVWLVWQMLAAVRDRRRTA